MKALIRRWLGICSHEYVESVSRDKTDVGVEILIERCAACKTSFIYLPPTH